MWKFFSKKIKLSQTIVCLGFAAFIVFGCNFFFCVEKFSTLSASGFKLEKFITYFYEISFNYFLIFSLLYFASFRRTIFIILLLAISFICGFASYSFNEFHVIIDQVVVANLLDNANDISDVFIIKNVFLYSLFYFFLPVLALQKIQFTKDISRKTNFFLGGFFLFFFIILASLHHQVRRGIIFSYQPAGLIRSVVDYYADYPSKEERSHLVSINSSLKTKNSAQKIGDLKVVLIIGESARAQNFSINGYARETSPRVAKIKNLLSFKTVAPCGNATAFAVPCMLSRQDSTDFSLPAKEESIIKVFQQLNFSTSWFSTQKAFGDDNALMLLALQAENFYFAEKIARKIGGNDIYDEYLLDDLKLELTRPRDSFIILHTQGSHFLYDDRYPKSFKIFSPTCNDKNLDNCKRQQIINSYDNSIAYTDFFINSVVDSLKNKNALLIYISDHGQFLGEDGIYYHGPNDVNSPAHQVPMFLWMSDNLMKNKFYRQKFYNAQEKIAEKLSHDNLFYSLLDCSGIEFSNKNNSSICQR